MALKWAREGEICGYHNLWIPKKPEGAPEFLSYSVKTYFFPKEPQETRVQNQPNILKV